MPLVRNRTPLESARPLGRFTTNATDLLVPCPVSPSKKTSFLERHSLSLAAGLVVLLVLIAYTLSDPASHSGAFFGNAIADWTGVFVSVLAAKHLSERKVRQPLPDGSPLSAHVSRLVHNHSLSLFLALTGIAWVIFYSQVNPEARWGQVVGSLVSEWTQNLGFVFMTKRLMEQSTTRQ